MKKIACLIVLCAVLLAAGCSHAKYKENSTLCIPKGEYEIELILENSKEKCNLTVSEGGEIALQYTDEGSFLHGLTEKTVGDDIRTEFLSILWAKESPSLPAQRIRRANIILSEKEGNVSEDEADGSAILTKNVYYDDKNVQFITKKAPAEPKSLCIYDEYGVLEIIFAPN